MRKGERVAVVVEGELMEDEDEMGLFDVDYGPGFAVATEGMLLENSPVVRRLIETARSGVAWRHWDEEREVWRCPRCRYTELTVEASRAGEVCASCAAELSDSA